MNEATTSADNGERLILVRLSAELTTKARGTRRRFTRKLLENIANIAWNDLPLDYLDTWTKQVQRVTAADIRAALGRKLDPARMVVVTVGAAPAR